MSDTVAADQLRQYIERAERVMEEIVGLRGDLKDVFAEAKGQGYDTKTMREIIKLRAMDPDARREREALLDTYKAALGMLDGTPLGRWALERLKPKQPDGDGQEDASPAESDSLFEQAVALVREHRKASVSWLQRQLRVGYNQAARLIERMEAAGLVSSPDHVGRREVVEEQDGSAPTKAEAEPEPTVDDARRMGGEAAASGAPVTANPFPAFDERRAAWDESWCAHLGSDGMDIPDALKPAPKAKKEPAHEPA
jgi:uncharacterized protein (UPF0335 family)